MAESMIERVARAMFDADATGYPGISVPFEGQSIGVQDRWLGLARAAIGAMRAVPEHLAAYLRLEGQHIAAYHDIIDAALNEQVSG